MADSRPNRRQFINASSAAVAAIAGAPELLASVQAAQATPQAGDRTSPDLIVVNATVYTMDARTPRAEAFAVSGGRFVAVGSTSDIRNLAGGNTQAFDARGMTVVPGFVDCHNHAIGEVLLNEVLVGNPFEVEFVSIRSIIGKLREKAQTVPPGTWVEGFFFDDTKVSDKRALTIRDLDEVSSEHPVIVRHRGGHTYFYNSKAFAMAGITRNTPNPQGGTYDKDANGELNGRVTDVASAPFNKVGTRKAYTAAEAEQRARDGVAHISKQFARYGLTSVHHQSGNLPAMQDVRARGELKHRIGYEPRGSVLESMITAGIQSGFGDEWIRFGATFEHMIDGSFSERTMALSTPYPGVTPPYQGNVIETQDTLNAFVERIHRAGIQVNCHANGDVAIDMYLTALERAQQLVPRPGARPKITHCTQLNASLVARIKALGAVPALFTTYAFYNPDKFVFYGEEMMQNCMAFRSLLDAGVYACAGSDFQPGPFAPLMGIQGMVTRRGWDGKVWGANQRISVSEAIAVNTYNGAWASGEEAIKGSITAGKLADYVVLANDPHTVDPEKIKDIPIVRTVVGGQISHQA
ncbi:MAG: amidohydrolase [Acidobacteriota bacterium]|nr:amidohydrolase [Acidobacteriota bacterium]